MIPKRLALRILAPILALAMGVPVAAQEADLVVTKEDDPDPVKELGTLTYTVTVTNNGPSDAVNVVATDTLPDTTTLVDFESTSGCAEDPNGVPTCSLGTVAAEDQVTYTIEVTVKAEAEEASPLENSVSVTSDTTEAQPGDESATEETVVEGLVADLELTKSDSPDPVLAGQPLTYTLTLTNHGPDQGFGVKVEDSLPLTFTHISNDCDVSYSPPNPFEWVINDMPAETTLTCTIEGSVNVGFDGEMTNTAFADMVAFMDDPDSTNDSVEEITTVLPADTDLDLGDAPDPVAATAGEYPTLLASDGAHHVLSADLFLGACADAETDGQPTAAADGDDGAAGSPVVGTCAVSGDDEDGVVFTSGLVQDAPATLEVTASAAGLLDAWIDWNADGDWSDDGEQVFTDESLAAGANALGFTVPADATPGPTFARFRLSSAGGLAPTSLATDGEVEDYPVTVEPPIEIAVGDVTELEGDAGTTPFAFDVSVSSTAVQVQVTGQSADGTATAGEDYTAVPPTVLTFPQGGPLTQSVTGDTTVEPDESFTVKLSSPSAGAVIADPTGLGTIQDDDAFKADVVGTKEVTGGDVARGGTVVYTVTLTNLGPGLQQDNPEDELVDVLPAELVLVSATADSGTATADPGTNTVTWNGEIPAGEMVTITIEAAIPEDTPLGTAIENQGTVFYDADGFTTNEATRLTDDPAEPGSQDPTVFLVGAASVLEIPTLGEWALWLLVLLLGASGVLAARP